MKKTILLFKIKRAVLCFILTLSLAPVFSQGTWSPRASLPDSAMFQGISGFCIGNYGYAGLGDTYYAGNPSPDLWQFNPSTNSWAKKAPFPGKARVAPACFVIGTSAYLVTGSVKNGGTCVTECWQYDATNNTWTQKANFPGSARVYAVGFAINGMGYVGTGANELSDFRKDFYRYNPDSNTWTRIADFGGIARSCACGFAVNGKGYVGFGQDSLPSGALNNDIWEYDPKTNTWTQKTSNPFPMMGVFGFAICDNIYIHGDTTQGFDYYRVFWKYNTITDTWTQEGNTPGRKRFWDADFSIGDTGYSGFGVDSTLYEYNAFYEFYGGDSCNRSTGYPSISVNQTINIFPNPATNFLNINFNGLQSGLATLSIMNILGTEFLSCEKNIGNDVTQVDVSSLPPGMYFLTLKNKDISLTQKFIKI